jgi:hypothetical protein
LQNCVVKTRRFIIDLYVFWWVLRF